MYGANDFCIHPKNMLFCNLCSIIVKTNQKFLIDKHRTPKKHIEKLIQIKSDQINGTQSFLTVKNNLWKKLPRHWCWPTYRCTSSTTNV